MYTAVQCLTTWQRVSDILEIGAFRGRGQDAEESFNSGSIHDAH